MLFCFRVPGYCAVGYNRVHDHDDHNVHPSQCIWFTPMFYRIDFRTSSLLLLCRSLMSSMTPKYLTSNFYPLRRMDLIFESFLYRVNGTIVVFIKLMLNPTNDCSIIRRPICIMSDRLSSYLSLAVTTSSTSPTHIMQRSVILLSNRHTIRLLIRGEVTTTLTPPVMLMVVVWLSTFFKLSLWQASRSWEGTLLSDYLGSYL